MALDRGIAVCLANVPKTVLDDEGTEEGVDRNSVGLTTGIAVLAPFELGEERKKFSESRGGPLLKG